VEFFDRDSDCRDRDEVFLFVCLRTRIAKLPDIVSVRSLGILAGACGHCKQ
jgi:hypothetical protein